MGLDKASLVNKLTQAMKLMSEGTDGERVAARKAVERLTERYPWLVEAMRTAQGNAAPKTSTPGPEVLNDLLNLFRGRAEEALRRAMSDAVDRVINAEPPSPTRKEPRMTKNSEHRRAVRQINEVTTEIFAECEVDEVRTDDEVIGLTVDFDTEALGRLLELRAKHPDEVDAAIGRAFVERLIELDVIGDEDEEDEDDEEEAG